MTHCRRRDGPDREVEVTQGRHRIRPAWGRGPTLGGARRRPGGGGGAAQKLAVTVFGLVVALAATGCSKSSNSASKAAVTTPSSTPASSPTTAPAATGPVTDADVTEVDQIIHRLDSELDRLDSDMATGEGEVQ